MKKKLLVLSSFPANYRVDAIRGLGQEYDITVVFNALKDQDRNPKWFVGQDALSYFVMNTPAHRREAKPVLKHLRQYDLIFAYDWVMPWSLPLLVRARLAGVPYILNSDGAFPQKAPFPKEQIKRFFVKGAAAYVTSGKNATESFLLHGADAQRIFPHHFTSLHRADVLAEPVSPEGKTALRKKLGLPEKTTFLSIGQFIERKGFDILLEGWKNLRREDCQLVILGGGGKRGEYEAQIEREGISNVILQDFVPFAQVFDYYKASDAFVLATREDIWGLVVNEAMACGIPVVISDRCIAGLELIENGQNGYIIENNTPAGWTEKITELADNPALREAMSRNNLAKIRSWCMEDTNEIDRRAVETVLSQRGV